MYDYVIVGAGSAGCVLAARLSEDPDVTVCLIEAGPADEDENIHDPVGYGRLLRTHLDWDYDSHDEPHLHRRRVYLPRGRVLGGSSSINAMVYARGHRLDYDGWGMPGWGFDDLLPYFRLAEDNERGESRYHGVGGPLAVSDGRGPKPSTIAFVEAAGQAGFAHNDDFNAGDQDGFGFFQVTQKDGRRSSAATAYLHPAIERPNLTVEVNLQVHRVLIDKGRAVGVLGRRLDEEVTVRAGREVVLAAGAYNTPQLLMLSGIGPADRLRAFGLPVVADLPEVGRNLQDHLMVPMNYLHSHPSELSIRPEAGGFVRTGDGAPAPDVEIFAAPVMFLDSALALPTAHAVSFGLVVLTPQSRGSVTLSSPAPTAKPQIVHNYLAEPADMRTAVAAMRTAMEIARQPAMAPYAEELHRAPASEQDADLRAYVRAHAHSTFHAAGTCALGPVVDDGLRLHGVSGLRVADTSVMPTVGRGHLHAAAVAIGEKAADLITGIRRGTAPAPAELTTSA